MADNDDEAAVDREQAAVEIGSLAMKDRNDSASGPSR